MKFPSPIAVVAFRLSYQHHLLCGDSLFPAKAQLMTGISYHNPKRCFGGVWLRVAFETSPLFSEYPVLGVGVCDQKL